MNKPELVKTLIESERSIGLVETLHEVFGSNIKVNIGFTKKDHSVSIEELDLSVRSYNALRRSNIITVGDLIDRQNEDKLRNIRNLGTKSYREIQTKLLVFGFSRLSDRAKTEFFHYIVENNTINK